MATITIPDDTFQKLSATAAARRISLAALLNDVAGEQPAAPAQSAKQLAAIESFISGMTAWTATHLPPSHIVDDSRERIYA